MPYYSSYSALGTSIETSEIGANQVTADKLAAGWKLIASGKSSAAALVSLTGLTARRAFKLIIEAVNDGSTTPVINLQFNGDASAKYGHWLDFAETQSITSIRVLATAVQTNTAAVEIFINGKGTRHGVQLVHVGGLENSGHVYLGGVYNGAADITRIDIIGSSNWLTLRYCLYYHYDLEALE